MALLEQCRSLDEAVGCARLLTAEAGVGDSNVRVMDVVRLLAAVLNVAAMEEPAGSGLELLMGDRDQLRRAAERWGQRQPMLKEMVYSALRRPAADYELLIAACRLSLEAADELGWEVAA